MSKSKETIQIRSEQVQEILTKIPNWMIRWGNLLFLCLILMLLIGSWFIKYPDVIVSQALITTHPPLQKIDAQTTGRIATILVKDYEFVRRDQPIAIIKNNADYKDVFKLISLTDKIHINSQAFDFPVHDLPILSLGSIETSYALFENNYLQYLLNKKSSSGDDKRARLLENNNMDINMINQEFKLSKDVIQSYNQLKNDIKKWDNAYVLRAKINGQVAFLNYWKKNQIVHKGDLIFTVIPLHSGYIAKLKVPTINASKIKTGQIVNINLDNYPASEYGVLKSKIVKKSPFPNKDGFYLIEASLPGNLVTTNHNSINFKQDLSGSAEIITEDLRLLERLFYKIKNIYKE
ncbi:HlyD family efflux transporter periplasmic adaptor subunit [Galbibacter sp. PAP.153]|uniref:HlyD family efflux transporter periplasmic adaptor subunit n=1 Tax=Galbibacter sp. PAP.153 TaxID=3104623 RepID=UPI00300B2EE8